MQSREKLTTQFMTKSPHGMDWNSDDLCSNLLIGKDWQLC